MLNQSAGLAHSGVVFPARSIQWTGRTSPMLRPGRYTSVPSVDTANCAPPVCVFDVTPSSTDVACPVDCQPIEIERHGKEHAVVEVQQVTARQIPAVIAAAMHDLPRAARQRLHDEVRIVVGPGRSGAV